MQGYDSFRTDKFQQRLGDKTSCVNRTDLYLMLALSPDKFEIYVSTKPSPPVFSLISCMKFQPEQHGILGQVRMLPYSFKIALVMHTRRLVDLPTCSPNLTASFSDWAWYRSAVGIYSSPALGKSLWNTLQFCKGVFVSLLVIFDWTNCSCSHSTWRCNDDLCCAWLRTPVTLLMASTVWQFGTHMSHTAREQRERGDVSAVERLWIEGVSMPMSLT